MALDEQIYKYRSLDDWFKSPQGIRVAKAFVAELEPLASQLRGDTLLQLGDCGDNLWLPLLPFQHKWVVNPSNATDNTACVSSLNSLPIDRDSIDCILAPLTMEAFSGDKNPIDEIDRVLKPMGYVIFFGFNPWSFWGLALRWRHLACFGHAAATMTSSFSVKHALISRGYRQCFHSSFYYIPPTVYEYLIRNLEFLNEVGKMVSPYPSGFYCFIAQKYQHCHPSILSGVEKNLLLQSPITLKI